MRDFTVSRGYYYPEGQFSAPLILLCGVRTAASTPAMLDTGVANQTALFFSICVTEYADVGSVEDCSVLSRDELEPSSLRDMVV